MSWVWLAVAIAWLVVPPGYMLLLGAIYTRRWERLEHRLINYLEHSCLEHTCDERAGEHTTELPRITTVTTSPHQRHPRTQWRQPALGGRGS